MIETSSRLSLTHPQSFKARAVTANHRSFSGRRMAVYAFVASQFMDVSIGSVGTLQLSAQKILVLVLLPLAALSMRRLHLPRPLIGLFGLLVVAETAGLVLAGASPSKTITATIATLTMDVLATAVFCTALSLPGGFDDFVKAWITGTLISSLLIVVQAFGFVPLFDVSSAAQSMRNTGVGGLIRGTGFKFDPNFAALLLDVGIVVARYCLRFRPSLVVSVISLIGIMFTFSRAGFIIGVVSLVLIGTPRPRRVANLSGTLKLRRLKSAGVVIGLLMAVWTIAPPSARTYVIDRGTSLSSGAHDLIYGGSSVDPVDPANQSSASQRAQLQRATVHLIQAHWVVGVGGGQVPRILGDQIGVDKPTHNTYLETIAMGGIAGIIALLYYWGACVRGIKLARLGGRLREARLARGVSLTIAAMAAVLTLDYNSIAWLPIALCLSGPSWCVAKTRQISES